METSHISSVNQILWQGVQNQMKEDKELHEKNEQMRKDLEATSSEA